MKNNKKKKNKRQKMKKKENRKSSGGSWGKGELICKYHSMSSGCYAISWTFNVVVEIFQVKIKIKMGLKLIDKKFNKTIQDIGRANYE